MFSLTLQVSPGQFWKKCSCVACGIVPILTTWVFFFKSARLDNNSPPSERNQFLLVAQKWITPDLRANFPYTIGLLIIHNCTEFDGAALLAVCGNSNSFSFYAVFVMISANPSWLLTCSWHKYCRPQEKLGIHMTSLTYDITCIRHHLYIKCWLIKLLWYIYIKSHRVRILQFQIYTFG